VYDDDYDDDLDDFEGHPAENDNIRQLRQQAERVAQAEVETAALRREAALLRAGYDTDSKLGALLLKSYGPDVESLDELVAEAGAHGVPLLRDRRQAPSDDD
jgi:hypothetical protein